MRKEKNRPECKPSLATFSCLANKILKEGGNNLIFDVWPFVFVCFFFRSCDSFCCNLFPLLMLCLKTSALVF